MGDRAADRHLFCRSPIFLLGLCSDDARLHRLGSAQFPARPHPHDLGFRYFNLGIGGLFSPESIDAPWSWARAWDFAKHLPVPAVVLGLAGAAELIRIMRANLLDELRRPYVMTARAKGITELRTLIKYPVRAALNPFASSIAYVFPTIVSGSIIVSLVLGLPTVGPLLLQALVAQDMYLAGAIILFLGVMTAFGTLLSNLLLMWVEPRLRLTGRL